LIRPDVTAQQFATAWRRIGRGFRVLLLLAAPLIGVWMLIVGPRRTLGSHIGIDDLPTDEEEEQVEIAPELDEALLGTRDGALTVALAELARGTQPCTVGVCWGAAHVRAIVPALQSLGFQVKDATWITVFT
jgi:hypothetical protein